MGLLKNLYKKNTHNSFFKALASVGRGLNRLYENRNHNIQSNGELMVIETIAQFNPATIVDGGANIGEYSEQLRKYTTASKIYAFEPVKSTFDILKDRMKDDDNIACINKGFFSEKCTKEIHVFTSNAHSSLYKQSETLVESISVNLIRGDDFIEEHNIEYIDFLKLDVEGAEYDAIKGFEKSFENGKIKAVQFEYGFTNIASRKLLADFYEFFEDYGYVIGKVYPKRVQFRDYELKHEDFLGPNFVVVHKSETSLIKALSLI